MEKAKELAEGATKGTEEAEAARRPDADGEHWKNADKQTTSLAWLGLGNFGRPIAACCHHTGYQVAPMRFKGHGATGIREFQEECPGDYEILPEEMTKMGALVLCLPKPRDVQEFLIANYRTLPPVIIDLTTGEPSLSATQADIQKDQGRLYVDCPVSGSNFEARSGLLAVFAGISKGENGLVDHFLKIIGGRVAYLGKAGNGMAGKAVNQLMHLSIVGVIRESMRLARDLGMDLLELLPALQSASGSSAMLERFGHSIVAGEYDPRFTLDLALKDLEQVAKIPTAGDRRYLDLALDIYRRAQTEGRGDENFTTICRS